MGKFPQIVECFFKKKKQVRTLIVRHKLPVAVMVSAVVAMTYFVYSQPSFYAQAFNTAESYNETSEITAAKASSLVAEEEQEVAYLPEINNEKFKSIFIAEESELEKELYEIVGDYPIREMVPYIAKKDKTVAAFIVGIAKKESNWGKRVPTLNGQDCYNYWGYKGAGKNGTAMGHGCFATPEEAVDVIGKRLEQLVEKNLTTPSKMVVWKCGSSCAATGGQAAANKWISDVSLYFNRIVKVKA